MRSLWVLLFHVAGVQPPIERVSTEYECLAVVGHLEAHRAVTITSYDPGRKRWVAERVSDAMCIEIPVDTDQVSDEQRRAGS